MKTITKKIPETLFFPVVPEDPEAMDQQYPYMHNLFVDPNVRIISTDETDENQMVLMIGMSDHMDDLKNAIHYAGILGRSIFCKWQVEFHKKWKFRKFYFSENKNRNIKALSERGERQLANANGGYIVP